MDLSQRIIIVGGCGTFGLSTAWHLSKRGYTNIICVDRWMFPSKSSAGFDRNKIVRTTYGDPLYIKLAEEAIQLWKQPIFKGIFHQTGWVLGTTAPRMSPDRITSSNSISAAGAFDAMIHTHRLHGRTDLITPLPDTSALQDKFSDFFSHAPGFRGIFDRNAGWVDAARALEVVGRDCQARGVRFVVGPKGTVKSLIRNQNGNQSNEVTGLLMEDGTVFNADKIVMCVGAYTESLIDMEGQVTAVAYSTAHIALTPPEIKKYQNMPVILVEGLGYAFPPDQNRHIKVCDLHVGHPWKQSILGRPEAVSLPRDAAYHETDTLPDEDVAEVRRFIDFCLPQFSRRSFDKTAMCWDTESFDYGWIIGPHPSSPNTLFLATAGSGHAFKNLPNLGKYVADCLEGCLSPPLQEAWRWRPEKVASTAAIDRVDLAHLSGWQHPSEYDYSNSSFLVKPKL
ncbi:hypothetical protein PGTUg99_001352 [Puccinia graminis f. sp. tritici]|uniref:FAD dependent oxidoreductase domain-containing protein n=1 Tax=Puccinia graminis f. sp. tritici TaxID=56615 RepID=A0A5B0RVL7_PUCGR|nr:hypothetical protein PGTUg99_029929 [Puccinia graminis f. sp. tritici]KAA1136756.1 hypothetical protein PGTUg99_001352 [Puccinia graminis f. sp. tritici]